jgi:sugar/nucleoside kinase (ribokinase family)
MPHLLGKEARLAQLASSMGDGMADVGCAGILVEDIICGPIVGLPAAGALLAVGEMPAKSGGCAANVAIDLAKQGVSVDVVGCLGRDSAGTTLLNAYEAHRIGTAQVTCAEGYQTSRCIILLVEGQDRRYLYFAGANRALTVDHISREWLSRLKVFYLGGLFVLPGIETDKLVQLLRFCRESRIATVVDVVVPQDVSGMESLLKLLPLIDVFVPNEDEARAFTGLNEPLDQLQAFERAGARTIIITRGGLGSVAASGGKRWRCAAYPTTVVDPSGSGDAFTSGLIRGLLHGWEMPQMLRYASAVGASVTRAAGTTDGVLSASEAEHFISANPLVVTEEG